jgi:uncharacterized membrane protein YdbT with pleckstrin-like domain
VTMSVKDNLIANEAIVFESEKHWIAPVRDSVVPVLLLIGAYFLGWLSPDNEGGVFGAVGNLMDLVRTGLVLFGIGWIVMNVIVWRTAEFAVTNLRVIREEGLISRRSSATLLGNVSDVKTSVPFIGGRLGYGDIVIYTQSGDAGADRFSTITHPNEFRDRIMTKKMEDANRAAAPIAVQAPAPPVAQSAPTAVSDDAATLARLAELRDSGAITPEDYEAKKTEILARM